MDPTEKGVWWRNDKQWERYSPAYAQKIIGAWRNGETRLSLGPFKSSRRGPGPLYSIDLASMKQTDLNSGLSRDIKIIPDSEDDQCVDLMSGSEPLQEGGSDEDFYGEISPDGQTARSSKSEVEKDKNVVTMIPSVTIELQKLSTQCRVQDQCNLVLKLPKAVSRSDARLTSLRSKTLSLLLEKLSSKDFIGTVLSEKWSGWLTRLDYKPYRFGQADQSARYGAFLTHLCALAEEEEDVADRLFRVVEQGFTAEGDPVEYLFTVVAVGASDHVLPGGTPPTKKQLEKETSVGNIKILAKQNTGHHGSSGPHI